MSPASAASQACSHSRGFRSEVRVQLAVGRARSVGLEDDGAARRHYARPASTSSTASISSTEALPPSQVPGLWRPRPSASSWRRSRVCHPPRAWKWGTLGRSRGTRCPRCRLSLTFKCALRGSRDVEVSGASGSVSLGGPKERRLLAQLIAHAPGVVSTHALIDGLWSGSPPRSAGRTLQAYVVRLRRALEPAQVLVTQSPGYRLAVGPEDVDALRFADLVVGARRAGERDWPSEADRLADEALRLWRGTPYAEFQDADFGAAEARRLEGLRLTALETRNDAQLALGRHLELVPSLEALCHEHPYCERFWAQLVVAFYRCGRQADALAAYRSARAVLVAEVGVEPGPELRRLEEQVLAQDPRLEVPKQLGDGGPLPAAVDPNGRRLAGRQSELAWLRTVWRATVDGQGRICVLAGPEGSGRTRLAAEIAGEAHAGGAAVVYAGPPGAAAAIADATSEASQRPVLLVLDDLDVLPDPSTLHLSAVAAAAVTRRLLVIATYDPARASAALRGQLLGASHDERRLEPLDDRAVARVVGWYAAEADAALVEQVSARSGGWPAAVHDIAGRLVGDEAAARVGVAAERAVRASEALAAVREDVRDGVRDHARARHVRAAQHGVAGRISCPYKGLSRYDEAEANLFFGRETLVTALCARLVDTPFLAVVGPSGSGKSSLVRAGLLPALADGVVPGLERLPRVVLAPGADPLAALEAAVPGGTSALIVADQFEEVFTAGAGAQARTAFFDALLATFDGDRSGRVVVTVRGDYVGACAEHAGLAARLAEGAVLVAPMTDEVGGAAPSRAGRWCLACGPVCPRANCWTIAEHARQPSPYALQRLLSRAVWDHDAVRDEPARLRDRAPRL